MKLGEPPFLSPQGEGKYTGQNSLWVRFFGCNLECAGFSQPDPTDPSTYDIEWKNIDLNQYKSVYDIPIITKGCDSAYSWSKQFKHLIPEYTTTEVVDRLLALLPNGNFYTPLMGDDIHLVFTGGEPLLKANQKNIIDIISTLEDMGNLPRNITIETNGTQKLTSQFIEFIEDCWDSECDIFFSVSPKLHNVSGELNDNAILPEVIEQYYRTSSIGQIKFVVNDTDACWNEMLWALRLFRDEGIWYPVTLMPVGSTAEQAINVPLCKKIVDNGFNLSVRVQSLIWGNGIGK
jgi:organic radical activating enzyme